jgi:hypothetical protein
MGTEKQINANRLNAQKSTGPTTPEGKAAVRHNALRHGLLAQDIFINAGDGREDPEDYGALLDDLRDALQPEGRLELIMVEKIAVAYWRLRRAARAEVGALRRVLDGLEERMREAQEDALRGDLRDLNRGIDSFVPAALTDAHGPSSLERQSAFLHEVRRRLRKNPLGVRHLSETLDEAIAEIQSTGELSREVQDQLEREFSSGRKGLHGRICAALSKKSEDQGTGDRGGEDDGAEDQGDELRDDQAIPLSDTEHRAVLQLLEEEGAKLERLIDKVDHRAAEALDTARLEAALPSEHDVLKIQRYETMYERQLYQAINQLERLQRRRLGELSAPPINLSVRRDG